MKHVSKNGHNLNHYDKSITNNYYKKEEGIGLSKAQYGCFLSAYNYIPCPIVTYGPS